MRILFYTFSFPPKVDGATSRALNTLRCLHESGHALCVATPQDPVQPPDWMVRGGVRLDTWVGARLPVYEDQWIGNPLRPGAWARIQHSLRTFRPDLVHLIGPDPGHWAAVPLCRAQGIPVVVSYHTDVLGYARSYGVPDWAVRLLEAGYSWSWIDRVVTTSPSFRARLIEEHRIRCDAVWPPGVDGAIFHPRDPDAALRRTLTSGRPDRVLAIYAGRFSREKELPSVLRIVEPFEDIHLALIGSGPDDDFRRNGLGDRLYVSNGFWSQEDVARAYACADVFITASRTETCGFSVLEAMACGLPVVAPAAQGLVDLVRHEQDGLLFAPGDESDARRQLRRLIEDDALRTRLRENARARAATLTWHSATRWLEGLYREVLSDRAGRRT